MGVKTARRVAILSDQTSGGAGHSCRRLFDGLRGDENIFVKWFVWSGADECEAWVGGRWPPLMLTILSRLEFRVRGRARDYLDRMARRLRCREMISKIMEYRPHIINIHNIHDKFAFDIIDRLPKNSSIVWTLHDMWPLTGYCCYSFDCRKYENGCPGECPEQGNWGPVVRSVEEEWADRRKILDDRLSSLCFVGPSKWLADCAHRAYGEKFKIEHIPYGLDTECFKPRGDKYEIRKALNLPVDKKIVLSGSQNLDEPRKGGGFFEEAISMLFESRDDFVVVTFGLSSRTGDEDPGWLSLGAIQSEELLSMYYSCADVFVLPTLADNLPNTLIEAISCGTPCVVSDVGGCSEIVRENQTGYLVEPSDAESLAKGIQKILDLDENDHAKMRKTCREVAVSEYSLALQATRYAALFDKAIKDHDASYTRI